MLELFGTIERNHRMNGVLVSSYEKRMRDEMDALKEWRVVHNAGGWFKPSPNRMVTFKSGPYRTAEEAKASLQRWLDELEYTKPKWWQWWRWDEPKYG